MSANGLDVEALQSFAAEAREAALLAGSLAEALIAAGASADLTARALKLAEHQVRLSKRLAGLASGNPG
jgi:hypothetical protein